MTGPVVVVVGSLNRDYVCTVDRLPGPGETRLGHELRLWSGGKGANQAVAAALLGAARGIGVCLVGAVGEDADGDALLAAVRRAGVDVEDVVRRAGVRTGAALITVARDGENTIVVAPGANGIVEPALAVAALDRRRPDVVVTQGELSEDVVAATIERAAELGARPLLNLAPVLRLSDTTLGRCDPLVVNAGEARSLLRTDEAVPAEALVRELAHRARSVVVTDGADGAWVGEGSSVGHVPARPAVAVDTTGAGDAFTGALAVGLATGIDVMAAARWGAVVAAYSVQRPGAQASFPSAGEVELE